MPTSREIIVKLSQHRNELRALGVRRLALFGSAARGQANEASDLDFLVELERRTFDSYMDVKEFLERLFAKRIDLVVSEALKPQLKPRILQEAIYAEGL
jgi:predicted nucleotidyltransferase